ncbi:MAG: SpoIIE family protein phosphatase [Bacteroidia bacterium]|jgi:ligand-binding sensor domain-containing protein/serine phosphatase RsbU (regulator of sigma subunit)|nr:SpoIIE family protein phosphatase [Bacteroidia bacterium]
MRTASLFRIFFLFIALLGIFPGFAQQYNFKLYSTRDGLVHSIVKTIFRDSRGYIWFGTQGGVSRFDGKHFVNFTEKNGLPGNDITSISEDGKGNIWIATYGFGVAMYDGTRFTIFQEDKKNPRALPHNTVYAVFPDKAGNMLVTTFGGGLARYNGKDFDVFNDKNGLPAAQLLKGTTDAKGISWIGTRGKGLYSFDGKTFTHYNDKNGLTATSYYSVLADSKGEMWLASVSKGIDILGKDGKARHLAVPEIEGGLISGMVEDRHGNYWIAAKTGLYKYNSSGSFLFTEANGLPSNNILSLIEDAEGNIWAGTTAGLCLFRSEAMVYYTDKEGLSRKTVTAFITDSRGNQLVGVSNGGLMQIVGQKMVAVDIPELNGHSVTAICEDRKGRIWVGCENQPLGFVVLGFENGKWTKLPVTATFNTYFASRTIPRIHCDRSGNVWVISYGSGLAVFPETDDKAQFRRFTDSTGLPTNNLLSMCEDKAGNIWVGTLQQGVIRFAPDGRTARFTEKEGLGDNTVWSAATGNDGSLFFGTSDNGISCWNGSRFTLISTEQGLCSDLVYALMTDSKGQLWAGTDKGVNVLTTGSNFALTKLKFIGTSDGMRSPEVSQNALFEDNTGLIWMGTGEGLARWNPRYDYPNNNPPAVVLNGIRLFYQPADWAKLGLTPDPLKGYPLSPVFSYRDNHLSFDFQALSTDNVSYQFMLEGLDDNWSPLTKGNEAVYTNIPPGHDYRFVVKAQNRDGVWSTEVFSYPFAIRPPFWKTWWFITLMTLLCIAGIIAFIRTRTARLQREKKVLEDRVQERTAELRVANDQLSVAYKDIKDSINYARRIQTAMLPEARELSKTFTDHFVFFRPRDVVSGDFYWLLPKTDRVYFAAIDCTGHGVPGAFMSIIGNSLLHEILNEEENPSPAQVLNTLRDKLMIALRQRGADSENRDGMDMVLCCWEQHTGKLTFSGANNPLYHFRHATLTEYKNNPQPIGAYGDVLHPFTETTIDILPGDVIYLFTDGYPDQFGGEKGKKYLYSRFKTLLSGLHTQPMSQQLVHIDVELKAWMGANEQVDDILVMGVRF